MLEASWKTYRCTVFAQVVEKATTQSIAVHTDTTGKEGGGLVSLVKLMEG